MNLQDVYEIAFGISIFEMLFNFTTFIKLALLLLKEGKSKEANALMKELMRIPKVTRKGINGLRKKLEELSISEPTQKELKELIKEMSKFKDKEVPEQLKGLEDLSKKYHRRIEIWHDRIHTELGNIIITQPYLDGNLNSEKLLKGIEHYFESTTWGNMQAIEKEDLQDFRTCYLNKAWTPAAIMVMRVIESSVRKYYFDLTGKKKTQWWKITDELMKNPKADKNLIKELDDLRKNVRNPLSHPELRMDSNEVEKAFLHAVIVLPKIYD